MSVKTNLPVQNLDFSEIESRLKEYLQSQDHWKDYDFSASGLDVFVKMLAHDQHQSALISHLQSSNWWLDSTTNRNAAVINAKSVGYIPKTVSASRAIVDLIVTENGSTLPDTLVLERGSTILGLNEIGNQQFIVTKSYSATKNGLGAWNFSDVEIVQGSFQSVDFVKDENDIENEFVLPNVNVDENFLEVYIQEGPDVSLFTQYSEASNIVDIDENSTIFFRYESLDGKIKIGFGDGILGNKIVHGQIIRIIYLITNHIGGNGYSEFSFGKTPNLNDINSGNIQIVTIDKSSGGSDKETLEEIKFHAPNHHFHKERTIIDFDYKDIIRRNFPEIKSVNVWGGEEIVSNRQDGKVFISLNVSAGLVLTEKKKEEIKNFIKGMSILGMITIEIVPAIELQMLITVNLNLTQSSTFIDRDSLIKKVKEKLVSYSEIEMNAFNKGFEHSRIANQVDEIHPSISSNTMDLKIIHYPTIFFNEKNYLNVSFDNEIVRGSLLSGNFSWQNRLVFISDDGNSTIQLFDLLDLSKIYPLQDIGTINYQNGTIYIEPIIIQSIENHQFSLSIIPKSKNIEVFEDRILKIEENNVSTFIE